MVKFLKQEFVIVSHNSQCVTLKHLDKSLLISIDFDNSLHLAVMYALYADTFCSGKRTVCIYLTLSIFRNTRSFEYSGKSLGFSLILAREYSIAWRVQTSRAKIFDDYNSQQETRVRCLIVNKLFLLVLFWSIACITVAIFIFVRLEDEQISQR